MPGNGLIANKETFDQYVSRSIRPLSCYHFSCIFAWKDFFSFTFEIIEERLCVFAHQQGGSFLYLPPLGGELKASVLEQCFKRMGQTKIARVENITVNQLRALKAEGYNASLKAHEYVYRRQDLADLAGRAYKSRRHDIHAFSRCCPNARFRPYLPCDYEGCVALYRQWANGRRHIQRDRVYLAMLEDNARVHAFLIENAEALGLTGRVIADGSQMIGYTFGYVLDEQTFCVLLEVTDLDKTGSAAYIFNCFCRDKEVSGFEFINAMDDFGMPNVAAAKRSYNPCQMLPVYVIKNRSGLC